MTDDRLAILHEGHRFLVVNKPAGIATEKNFTNDTVEARALRQFRRPRSLRDPFVGIVHRLDRVTSGALLLALNKSTLVSLNEAFADRRAEKVYWAVTDHPLPAATGRLRHFLGRDRTGRRAVAATRPLPGTREATLDYRLVSAHDGQYAYEIRPLTGRFHQIRAQLSAAGCPIQGDADYGSARPLPPYSIALHARSLRFPDPASGEAISVTAPPPAHLRLFTDAPT